MRWCLCTRVSPEYRLHIAQFTSVTIVSPYPRHGSLTMYLQAVINQVYRCTWIPRRSELRDVLGGRDGVNSEMHSDSVISSLQIHSEAVIKSVEMHLEAVIERVWTCTWRLRSSELRDALGGHDWVCCGKHLEDLIDQDWRSTWRRSI